MPRTTELIVEESAPVSSPLRRSSRIVAVNLPSAEVSKPIRSRRSSATQENNEEVEAKLIRSRTAASTTKEEVPAKTRARRSSATIEPKEEPKPEASKTKVRGAAITTEPKEEEPKRQPIGRRRRSSATENAEPDLAKQTKSKSTEEEAAKRPLRGRRSSVQEDKGPEEETNVRTTRSTRSASREVSLEPEEKKPATRGRRKSVDTNETEIIEKKTVRTRRSSSETLDGEPEVKVSKTAPSKPKRRLSITENAVNLAPIAEQDGERKSLSPVRTKSAEVSQLTPAKKKQEAAKPELDLSIINETSFNEESDVKETPEVVVKDTDDGTTKEPTANQASEEEITSPKKSPRFRQSKSPKEDAASGKDKDSSPSTPRKSPETSVDLNGLKPEENVTVERPSTPRKSPRIQAKTAKIVSPEVKAKDKCTRSLEETAEENQSATSHPAESGVSSLTELNVKDDSVFTSEPGESVQMKIKESTHISTGSDDSFRFHISDARLQSTSQEEDVFDELNTSKTSDSSDKENVVINIDDSLNQSKTGKTVRSEIVKALVTETKTKFEQNPVIARVSNVFRPKNVDYSYVEPMEVDIINHDKTANESKLHTDNPDESVDESFRLQLEVTNVESSDHFTKQPEIGDLKKTLEKITPNVLSNKLFQRKSVGILDESNVEDPKKLDVVGKELETTLEKAPNDPPKQLAQEDSLEASDDSIVIVDDFEKPEVAAEEIKEITAGENSETPLDKSNKLDASDNFIVIVDDFERPEVVAEEMKEITAGENLETPLDKSNELDDIVEDSKKLDLVGEEIKEINAADNLETPLDKSLNVPSNKPEALKDSIVIEGDSKKLDVAKEVKEIGAAEMPAILVAEESFAVSKKVDMSQDYDFDLPSEDDDLEKTNLLDTSKVSSHTDKVETPEEKESNDSFSGNVSVSEELELVTKQEAVDEVEVIFLDELSPGVTENSHIISTKGQDSMSKDSKLKNTETNEFDDATDQTGFVGNIPEKQNEPSELIMDNRKNDSSTSDEKLEESNLIMEAQNVIDPTKDSALEKSETNTITEVVIEQSTGAEVTKSENNEDKKIETTIMSEGEEIVLKENIRAGDLEDMEKSFQDIVNDSDSTIGKKIVQEAETNSKDIGTGKEISLNESTEKPAGADKSMDSLTLTRKSKRRSKNRSLNDSILSHIETIKSSEKIRKSVGVAEDPSDEAEDKSERAGAVNKNFNIFEYFKKGEEQDNEDPAGSKPKEVEKSKQSSDEPIAELKNQSPKKKKKTKSKKPELSDGELQTQSSKTKVGLEDFANSKLDEFIAKKLTEMENEPDSSDPGESESSEGESDSEEVPDAEDNVFLDTQAEEGEEDTPSEGSNDIVDEGESIHSESDRETDDDYDSQDSFICDNDVVELLSGDEYDLEDTERPKKKSRIINVEDFEGDIITIEKKEKPVKPKKKSRIIRVSSSSDEDVDVIEIEDDFVPSTSQLMSNQESSKRRSSITIIENINVQDIEDTALTERIHNLVDNFCTSIPKKGDISMNLSLEYGRKSSSEDSLQNEKQKSPKVILKSPRAEETSRKGKGVKRTSSPREEQSPTKRGRLSSSLENLSVDSRRETPKRRLSQSLDELVNKKNKKKSKKAKKSKAERSLKQERRPVTEGDLQTQTFSLMNQLITDVKNRPKRVIKPTSSKPDSSGSWLIDIANMKPSTSIVSRREIENFKKSKRHPKDFRNEMLYDSSRVKRIETKTLLKKKGAYY